LKTGCIVLAGGKSSRLGLDKAWVELGGQTLLQRAVNNLEFLGKDIVIVAAPGQRLPCLTSTSKLKIVRDITSGKGPLVGLYTGLCAMEDNFGFALACDMPFVNRALVREMARMAPAYDVVIPRRKQGLDPLHAVYNKSCTRQMETLLNLGRYKIDNLLEMVAVRYLEEEEMKPFDPRGLSLFNINTPADLVRAGELLKESDDIRS
jgi:molybdopterin-guanine dinucleotide biosynthesis protein A